MTYVQPTPLYVKKYPEQTVVIHTATGLLAVLKNGYGCSLDAGQSFSFASYLEVEPTAEQKQLFRTRTIGRNACLAADEFTLL
jgi:hypothetical protein